MAARGSQSKELITNKILEVFEGSFINDKELRIPVIENGEEIQIKITLTAAKTNVENPKFNSNKENDSNIQIKMTLTPKNAENHSFDSNKENKLLDEPTEEEKRKVEDLCKKLNL